MTITIEATEVAEAVIVSDSEGLRALPNGTKFSDRDGDHYIVEDGKFFDYYSDGESGGEVSETFVLDYRPLTILNPEILGEFEDAEHEDEFPLGTRVRVIANPPVGLESPEDGVALFYSKAYEGIVATVVAGRLDHSLYGDLLTIQFDDGNTRYVTPTQIRKVEPVESGPLKVGERVRVIDPEGQPETARLGDIGTVVKVQGDMLHVKRESDGTMLYMFDYRFERATEAPKAPAQDEPGDPRGSVVYVTGDEQEWDHGIAPGTEVYVLYSDYDLDGSYLVSEDPEANRWSSGTRYISASDLDVEPPLAEWERELLELDTATESPMLDTLPGGFKAGDRVRIGGKPQSDNPMPKWAGLEAVVLERGMFAGDLYLEPLTERPDMFGKSSFNWPVNDLELVVEEGAAPEFRVGQVIRMVRHIGGFVEAGSLAVVTSVREPAFTCRVEAPFGVGTCLVYAEEIEPASIRAGDKIAGPAMLAALPDGSLIESLEDETHANSEYLVKRSGDFQSARTLSSATYNIFANESQSGFIVRFAPEA